VKEPKARPLKATEIDKLSIWPQILRADVETYGAAAVNEAGLKALGYPGLWALEEFEVNRIREVLKERSDNVHTAQ
jgi:hypothetical protein